ncbi:MAG: STAS domain-containing protein [Acidobacteriia bacterium]|nr:STAS domain-containing protein [Terriglobia bacterium]
MQLETSCRTFGDAVIVDCKGRIVFGEETAFLRHQVKDLLHESRQIVLNLADVHYIDSTGVGELVSLYTSARNRGGSIKLAGLTGRVKDVLQITKLATVFQTFDTAEEASADFNREAGRTAAAEWAG